MVNRSELSTTSPRAAGFRMPAEWSHHRTCYTAWPAHEYAWGPHLAAAQREFCAFARAFTEHPAQESLSVLCEPAQLDRARALLPESDALRFIDLPYGDVWLRDTGPVFLRGPSGVGSVRFRHNGWGGKFVYPNDAELGARLAALRGGTQFAYEFVLEGGAIEVDGQGTCLTTRSCLQNQNRDPVCDERALEARLSEALGVSHVIWLDAGLANDHTDGHIDNLARFAAPGVVVCMEPAAPDDPNRAVLEAIASLLERSRDASGRPFDVRRIPSPGRVLGADGAPLPASYMNFYIGNQRVLMPSFDSPFDEPARAALAALFPQREVVASSARALLEGGGTFHCMTQQEPSP